MELAAHVFAQQALALTSDSSCSDNAVNATAESLADSDSPSKQRDTTPKNNSPPEPTPRKASNTKAGGLLASLFTESDEAESDHETETGQAEAANVDAMNTDRGDAMIDAYLERKTLEQAIAENNAMHDERVIRLISSGFLPRESIEALAATKVGGFESTKRSLEHLRVKSGTPMSAMSKAVGECHQRINKLTNAVAATGPAMSTKADAIFGPSLSDFVSSNRKAEDLAGRAQQLHDRSAFGHLSCPARAAINLKEIVRQGSDAELRDTKWLGAICLAVCEDCSKCAANKAKKRDRDESDRAKLLSSFPTQAPGPAAEPWTRSDAKHDRTLPRLHCFVCSNKQPQDRSGNNWLYHCDKCHQAAHEECERLTEWIENSGRSTFLCKRCLRENQAALDVEHRRPTRDWTNSRYIGGGGPAGSGLTSPNRHPPTAGATGSIPRRSQATPPGSPAEISMISPRASSQWDSRQGDEITSLLQKLVDNCPNSGTKDASTLNTSANSSAATGLAGASNTNVKINNYVMWEETSAGRPKPGIETGSGVAAWAWFKRTNIPIRDAAVNMRGGLGLLAANAISHNMQITLAAGMLNEAEVQPEQNMTEREIDLWVKRDREFTWFKTLPDAILIKVMDRLSASVNPAPFFRLVIAAEIPTMKDGDLYYPVTEFNSHADKWISTLSDLIKGGWQEGSTNLKQVFLASICTCQLVYDQAKREMHEDVLRLIATLKKWIVVQDNEIQSARAAKASIKNKHKASEPAQPDSDKNFEKRVRALFTSMNGSAQQQETPKLSAAHTGPMWQCQSCGNEWRDDPAKPPRCKRECVYSEHKDFNKSTKYPKGANPLSWKAYGEPYPPKQQAFFDKRDTMKGASGGKPEGRRK